MPIVKIGITGHRPSGFADIQKAKIACERTVIDCQETYENPTFNVGGCIGADAWVTDACLKFGAPYNLYLPFPGSIQAKFWAEEQRLNLKRHVEGAKQVNVAGLVYSPAYYHARDRLIVDNSDIIICFWSGIRSGGTYNTVKYAIRTGRPVYNAIDNMKVIDFEQGESNV